VIRPNIFGGSGSCRRGEDARLSWSEPSGYPQVECRCALAGDRVRDSGAHGRPQECGGCHMKGVLQRRACALRQNVTVISTSLCKGVMVASVVGQRCCQGHSAERFPSTLPTSHLVVYHLGELPGNPPESITLSELRTVCLRNFHVTFDLHELVVGLHLCAMS
jgi:hypothetical protein